MLTSVDDVIDFWFNQLTPKQWWQKDDALDQRIRTRFLTALTKASRSELFTWRQTAEGRLAEIIVLDQFSRNIHRDSPQAFSQDTLALALAQEAVATGILEQLFTTQQAFLLLPYMHSESPLIHTEAERLFQRPGLEENYRAELRHKDIIDRFGRYPHRNEILGRPSTEEEFIFLKQPGSSF